MGWISARLLAALALTLALGAPAHAQKAAPANTPLVAARPMREPDYPPGMVVVTVPAPPEPPPPPPGVHEVVTPLPEGPMLRLGVGDVGAHYLALDGWRREGSTVSVTVLVIRDPPVGDGPAGKTVMMVETSRLDCAAQTKHDGAGVLYSDTGNRITIWRERPDQKDAMAPITANDLEALVVCDGERPAERIVAGGWRNALVQSRIMMRYGGDPLGMDLTPDAVTALTVPTGRLLLARPVGRLAVGFVILDSVRRQGGVVTYSAIVMAGDRPAGRPIAYFPNFPPPGGYDNIATPGARINGSGDLIAYTLFSYRLDCAAGTGHTVAWRALDPIGRQLAWGRLNHPDHPLSPGSMSDLLCKGAPLPAADTVKDLAAARARADREIAALPAVVTTNAARPPPPRPQPTMLAPPTPAVAPADNGAVPQPPPVAVRPPLQQSPTIRIPDPGKALPTRPDGAAPRAGGYVVTPSPNARAAVLAGLENHPARGLGLVECRLTGQGGLDHCLTRLSPADATGRSDPRLDRALADLAALYRFEGVDFAATPARTPYRLTFAIAPAYNPAKPPVITLDFAQRAYGLTPLPAGFRLIAPTRAQIERAVDPIPVPAQYDVQVAVICDLDAAGAAHTCVAASACESRLFLDTAKALAPLYRVTAAPKGATLSLTFAFYSPRTRGDPGGYGELVGFSFERGQRPCLSAPPVLTRPPS